MQNTKLLRPPLAFKCFLFLLLNVYCSAKSGIKLHKIDAQVYQIKPTNDEALQALQKLDGLDVDFWSPPVINHTAKVMIHTKQIPQVLAFFKKHDIGYSLKISNVQKHLNEEKQQRLKHRKLLKVKPGDLTWKAYSTLDEIYAWLEKLVAEHPDDMTLTNIAKTFEGRDLKLIKFIKGGKEDRPTIWIDSGIHAREWIAFATGSYIFNQLVKLLDSKDENALDHFNIYFMPVVNPDGYVYSHASERLWRKNRRDYKSPDGCIGVDINRNFDIFWDGKGTSTDACEEIYGGPSPFSEIESQAMRDTILGAKDKGVHFIAYLTIHAFGKLWLTQWGYDSTVPDDYNELESLGKLAVKAIKDTHGEEYTVGGAGTLFPPGGGGSDDWAKAKAGIKYSYTIELRPHTESSIGFELPPDQIIPVGEEIWAAFQVLFKFWENNPVA